MFQKERLERKILEAVVLLASHNPLVCYTDIPMNREDNRKNSEVGNLWNSIDDMVEELNAGNTNDGART